MADAEHPDHLVFILSSYLSNNARTWLDKIIKSKSYKIHVIEGKKLNKLILNYPDIFSHYFLDKFSNLLIDTMRFWLVHDKMPILETILAIYDNVNLLKMNKSEICFLWCAAIAKFSEISSINFHQQNRFMFEKIENNLLNYDKVELKYFNSLDYKPVDSNLNLYDSKDYNKKCIFSKLILNSTDKPYNAIYAAILKDNNKCIEIIIESKNYYNSLILLNNENEFSNIYKFISDKPNYLSQSF